MILLIYSWLEGGLDGVQVHLGQGLVVLDDVEEASESAGEVQDLDARKGVDKGGLGTGFLGPQAQFAVGPEAPDDRVPRLGGAGHIPMARPAMSDDVLVVGQGVDELGLHHGLRSDLGDSPKVDVPVVRLDQRRAGSGGDLGTLHALMQGVDETGKVLVLLTIVSQTAIVPAAPGEEAGPEGVVGRGLEGEGVVLPTGNLLEADGFSFGHGDGLFLLVVGLGGRIGLVEDGPPQKGITVGKGQFVGRHKVLAGLPVAQLAKFRRPRRIQTALGVEGDGKVLPAGNLGKGEVGGDQTGFEGPRLFGAGLPAALARLVGAEGPEGAVGLEEEGVGLAQGGLGDFGGNDGGGRKDRGGCLFSQTKALVAAPAVGLMGLVQGNGVGSIAAGEDLGDGHLGKEGMGDGQMVDGLVRRFGALAADNGAVEGAGLDEGSKGELCFGNLQSRQVVVEGLRGGGGRFSLGGLAPLMGGFLHLHGRLLRLGGGSKEVGPHPFFLNEIGPGVAGSGGGQWIGSRGLSTNPPTFGPHHGCDGIDRKGISEFL